MSMPEFDDNTEPQGPKRKPRKPMKKRRRMKRERPPLASKITAEPELVKQRKKYKPRATKVRVNGHLGKRYTKEQYETINSLLRMTAKERDAVLDIVRGLAK